MTGAKIRSGVWTGSHISFSFSYIVLFLRFFATVANICHFDNQDVSPEAVSGEYYCQSAKAMDVEGA